MSSTVDLGRDDADVAAEYVLGVLDGASRRQVERRAAGDRAFADEIAAWTRRLLPMTAAVKPVEPSVGLWSQIASELDRLTRRPVEKTAAVRRVSAVWQWLAIGGLGLAAASLAGLLALGPLDIYRAVEPTAPRVAQSNLAATLEAEDGVALLTIVVDRDSDTATLVPVRSTSQSGLVPELWLLPTGDAPPQSLGLIETTSPFHLDLNGRSLPAEGGTLAISLEPEGGSPTGLPTGPVVASGPLGEV